MPWMSSTVSRRRAAWNSDNVMSPFSAQSCVELGDLRVRGEQFSVNCVFLGTGPLYLAAYEAVEDVGFGHQHLVETEDAEDPDQHRVATDDDIDPAGLESGVVLPLFDALGRERAEHVL